LSKSRSVSQRFKRLRQVNPTAAAVIENWVDQALADSVPRVVGATLLYADTKGSIEHIVQKVGGGGGIDV
jgi:hypothetical protein